MSSLSPTSFHGFPSEPNSRETTPGVSDEGSIDRPPSTRSQVRDTGERLLPGLRPPTRQSSVARSVGPELQSEEPESDASDLAQNPRQTPTWVGNRARNYGNQKLTVFVEPEGEDEEFADARGDDGDMNNPDQPDDRREPPSGQPPPQPHVRQPTGAPPGSGRAAPSVTETINKYVSRVDYCVMQYNDDFHGLDISEVSIGYLKSKAKVADGLKTWLQEALPFLQRNMADLSQEYVDQAIHVKSGLIKFVRDAEKVLKEHEVITSRPPSEMSTGSVAKQIKKNKVNLCHPKLVEKIKIVVDDLDSLEIMDPTNDQGWRKLDENFDIVKKRAEVLSKEARQLADTAIDAEMEEVVLELEDLIITIDNKVVKNETMLMEGKSKFGITGAVQPHKIKDLKPPIFSGDHSDKLDYYSFKKEYDEYMSTQSLSLENQMMILQKTCLQGNAKSACRNLKTEEEIWALLKSLYGNVKLLCDSKLAELRKLGSCHGTSAKKRDWAVQVKSKLIYLHDLAIEHGIKYEVYYSPVIIQIQHSLPEELHLEFKKRIKKADKGSRSIREHVFLELLGFMDDAVEDLTFELDYELENPDEKTNPVQQKYPDKNKNAGKTQPKKTFSNTSSNQPQHGGAGPQAGGQPQASGGGSGQGNRGNRNQFATQPQEKQCKLCNGKHTHLYYCEEFQKTPVNQRYKMAGKVKACFRCLRMDSNVDTINRPTWWDQHKVNCSGDWTCAEVNCGTRPAHKQFHITMCSWHINENKQRESDFIKSLDRNQLKAGVKFFTAKIFNLQGNSPAPPSAKVHPPQYKILPDPPEHIIFMIQYVTVDSDKKLLLFYD